MENNPFKPKIIPEDKPVSTEESAPKDFLSTVKTILSRLQVATKQGVIPMKYKPSIETTSTGRIVTVKTIVYGNSTLNMHKEMMMTQELVLIVVDPQTQKILGVREMQIGTDLQTYGIRASGSINIAERNQGIATVLDRTLANVLSKVAAENKKPVTWEVSNENENILKKLKYQREKSLSAAEQGILDKQIVEKSIEQERWQNLYGENGKLGFAPSQNEHADYEKIVNPDATATEMPTNLGPEELAAEIKALQSTLEK